MKLENILVEMRHGPVAVAPKWLIVTFVFSGDRLVKLQLQSGLSAVELVTDLLDLIADILKLHVTEEK